MAGRSLTLRSFPPDDEEFARYVLRAAAQVPMTSDRDVEDIEHRVRAAYPDAHVALQHILAIPPGSKERILYAYRDGDALTGPEQTVGAARTA